MAPKRLNPLEDPPTASSSDEEEGVSMEEDEDIGEEEIRKEDSSSEEEEDEDGDGREVSAGNLVGVRQESAPVVTIAVPGKTVAPPQPASDSDSGSETETDSDSETQRRDKFSTMESAVKLVTAKPGSGFGDALASSAKSTAKRPNTTERPPKDVKRTKKEMEGKFGTRIVGENEKKGGEDTKKTYFQRLWSEDDEIAVLKGIIEFKTDTGVSPFDDINGYYELAKKFISFEVSKIQFMDKIRSLKKKYVTNLGKGKNGEDPSFAKAHDRNAFELSRTIWGPDGMALESAAKTNGKSKKTPKGKMRTLDSLKQELFASPNGKKEDYDAEETTSVVKNKDTGFMMMLVKAMSVLGADELAVKQGWDMIASENKKKLEEKWKALRVAEIDFLVQKSEFIRDVSKLIAETFQSNN